MLNLDWIILVICFGLAWPAHRFGEPFVSLIENKFAQLARSKRVALAALGSAAVVARLALLWWIPVPQPKMHDELSYLLAADTFAHGRLANPPHRLWIFFDTFHVIQHPTYASIYPPAQGALLAFGKLLGHPWIGVLLSTAIMCMAMTWMLQGWVPAEWALLGGALVLFRFGVFSYWTNSYWGGSLAAIGAALVLGAWPRILKDQRIRDASVLGLGAGILATTRPLEGFIFCLPVAVSLLWWYLRGKTPAQNANARRAFLALASLLFCVIGLVGYNNWRVTHDALVFPYLIEQNAYLTTPVFVWQQTKPPLTYANPQFDDFYNNWLPTLYRTSWDNFKNITNGKLFDFWKFFLGPALSIPFLALPWLLGSRQIRLLLVQAALSLIGLLAVVWFHPHYAAPLMVTMMLLMILGLRQLRKWRYKEHPIGIGVVRLIVLFSMLIGPIYFVISRAPSFSGFWIFTPEGMPPRYLLGVVMTVLVLFLLRLRLRSRTGAQFADGRIPAVTYLEFLLLVLAMMQVCIAERTLHPANYAFDEPWVSSSRVTVEQRFMALPGEHLVLVRYAPNHYVHDEFVYNDADIDHAKTVWAREIPGQDLNPLLTYFRTRDVWVFEPDEKPFRLYPYLSGRP